MDKKIGIFEDVTKDIINKFFKKENLKKDYFSFFFDEEENDNNILVSETKKYYNFDDIPIEIFDKIQDTTAAVTSSDKNTTSIGENCTIDGDITFDKSIEIHGKITGTVKIAENCTTAMLIIKKNGIVEGNVYGDEVVIEGEVIGNVTGKKKITIKSSSFVSGNVYYDNLNDLRNDPFFERIQEIIYVYSPKFFIRK